MSDELCIAKTKAGDPCKGKKIPGTDFCMAHQPKNEEQMVPDAVVPSAPTVCGHVNLHSHAPGGGYDKPTCTKPKGHSGNHRGMHYERNARMNSVTKVVEVLREGWVEIEWTDDAGVPAERIRPAGEASTRFQEPTAKYLQSH